MYKFREEEYDSIEDVFNDVHDDDFLYEQYLQEALNSISPFIILNGISSGNARLAEDIYNFIDKLILQDIEDVEE